MNQSILLGFNESGHGKPLMLVHGFPLDARLFGPLLPALSDLRRVIAVDLRGRARSPHQQKSPWTLDDHADDILYTADTLGLESFDLAGLSMGGYIAWSLWRRHPKRLRSLILLSTRAAADLPATKQNRHQLALRLQQQGQKALLSESFPQKLLAANAQKEAHDILLRMILETPPQTAAYDSLAMAERLDATALLPSIRIPTLVVHGKEDAVAPIDQARDMAAQIPGSKLIAIEHAGHLPPIEAPEATHQALRHFLVNV